jgi:hypothetical protein
MAPIGSHSFWPGAEWACLDERVDLFAVINLIVEVGSNGLELGRGIEEFGGGKYNGRTRLLLATSLGCLPRVGEICGHLRVAQDEGLYLGTRERSHIGSGL